ncbi:MAG: adaptor protein MecA [Fusicatenibacter sp.]|nr:adaptor protein MecA [Fusicatenibacter sp.]
MKIEKISDNQIRCTLTSADLANRKIKLSELAYGTEKARNLFQDMMLEANQQFGFNSENSPLMVEAIPVAPDSIVLIITKVDDPQELDTRFAKFAPSGEDEVSVPESPQYSGADDIIDLFQKLCEMKSKAEKLSGKSGEAAKDKEEKPVDLVRMFHFATLDDVIHSARVLNQCFCGNNSLYRNHSDAHYQLVLHQSGYTPEDFNKICNVLSEYGKGEPFTSAGEAFLLEHDSAIVKENALQQLAAL